VIFITHVISAPIRDLAISRSTNMSGITFPARADLHCLLRCHGRWSRWARNSSIEAKRIMPSGIWASIDPSEYNE
jgi:hypothetical protein